MKDLIMEAMESINSEKLEKKKITAGFDGSVDIIYKAIKKRGDDITDFYRTMGEFGGFINEKGGMSCGIEVAEQARKAGGNCTIFSNAVSECGVQTTAVGLFGKSKIEEVFSGLQKKCRLYSYGDSVSAISIEFSDGKVIIYPETNDKENIWECIVRTIGQNNMDNVFKNADLLGLLNWSELPYSTCLWQELYHFLKSAPDKNKKILIDLSDCTRISINARNVMICLLTELSKVRSVFLSLNESEMIEFSKMLGYQDSNYIKICKNLAQSIKIDTIVVHSSKCCYTINSREEISSFPTQFNPSPVLLTGGGDNFNAGYALGMILEQRGEICNVFGNAMSGYYITYGLSPDLQNLKKYMQMWYQNMI
jgi:sugar/nucleoside kinase (ribokinase family)